MRGWAASAPSFVVDGLACDLGRTAAPTKRPRFTKPHLEFHLFFMLSALLFCFPRRLPEPSTTAIIPQTKTTMSIVERDMWDHYNTSNEKYRAIVEHRAIGWERSRVIPKGSAGGKQPLQPDVTALTFPLTQRERCATLVAVMTGMDAKTGAVEEHNQVQHERTRAATLPLLSTTAGSFPSKKTVSEWKRESQINDEETSSESNSEAEDGEPDWTQVNASKGYGSAAYFVRRDHLKTKATREREKAELAKAKAVKIVERAERAVVAEKAYEEHNLKFPTRPTTGRVKRRLAHKAPVEHVEDVAVAEVDSEVFHVTATFEKGTKGSKVVRLRDGVSENTPFSRRVSILKSKTKSHTGRNIENDPKIPKVQLIVVSATPQEPTACTAQTFNETLVPTASLASGTAYTAQSFSNTNPTIASSSSEFKGKRKATPTENQLIETERNLYGWYATSLPTGR